MLAAHFRLLPGESHRARFVISWYFPNVINYWNTGPAENTRQAAVPPSWKNFYATLWEDSAGVATSYAFRSGAG